MKKNRYQDIVLCVTYYLTLTQTYSIAVSNFDIQHSNMQNLMTSHIQSTLLLLCVSTFSSACVVTSHVKKKDCLDGDCSSFTLSKSGLVKQKPDRLDPLSYQ